MLTLLTLGAFAQGLDLPPDPSSVSRDAEVLPLPDDGVGPESVVGGIQVPNGEWDDTVGIVFRGAGGYVGCTGTLVHPKVVFTAGHCVGAITHVLVGSKDWARDSGDLYEVAEVHEYPDSQRTLDVAVLVLEERVKDVEPRAIAMECITDAYLEDGAEVTVVGFGVTREDGGGYNSAMNMGTTYIQDAEGTEWQLDGMATGFNPAVNPGGEVGAGGNGVDACFGDSGGPLYLMTDEGSFLVGITSRAYAGVPWDLPCRDGGVYARPDAVLDWAEEVSGKTLTYPRCNEAPEISVDEITVAAGESISAFVNASDVDGPNGKVTYEIVQAPEHGIVEVLEDGELRFTADGDYHGDDSFTLAATDMENREYPRTGESNAVELDVPVKILTSLPAVTPGEGGPSEVSAGCACSSGGLAGGKGWLLFLAPLLVFRRRI